MSKRSFSIAAFSLAIAAAVYYCFILYAIESGHSVSEVARIDNAVSPPTDDTSFGGIFYEPQLNDSLPHYAYQHMQDSVMQIKNAIKNKNQPYGDSHGFGCVFTWTIDERDQSTKSNAVDHDSIIQKLKDSLNWLENHMADLPADTMKARSSLMFALIQKLNTRIAEVTQIEERDGAKNYYLGLGGYTPAIETTHFFVDKNGFNLAYLKPEDYKRSNGQVNTERHFERKAIRVRYDETSKQVLLPVTKSQHHFISVAIHVCSLLFLALAIYFLLGLPIQIIWNIFKGRAFTVQNTKRLRQISIVLFIDAVLATIAPYFLKLLFIKFIPSEFKLAPFSTTLLHNLPVFFCAVAVYLIAKAFESGYRLQQENSLTI